jgi:hypothetical protein
MPMPKTCAIADFIYNTCAILLLTPVRRMRSQQLLQAVCPDSQAYAGMSKGQIKKAKARAKAAREAAGASNP